MILSLHLTKSASRVLPQPEQINQNVEPNISCDQTFRVVVNKAWWPVGITRRKRLPRLGKLPWYLYKIEYLTT